MLLAAATSFYEDPLTLFVIGLILMLLFFWYFATEIERRKRNVGSILCVGVAALCILATLPPKERLKGSIDILGGSSFSLRIQPREDDSGNRMPITKEQIDQAIAVIEKRLNSMGNTEPQISQQGSDGILVQMPGVKPEDSKRIRETLEKVAKLELHEVSPRNEEAGAGGKTLAARVEAGDEIVPGYRAFTYKHKDADGNEMSTPILLNRHVALGGKDIALATPSPQQIDAVAITLNNDGTNKMIALTQPMTPQRDRIAIVLDGIVISAPVVNSVPLGKNFIVEGLREPGEVQSLANALMNPLENALVVEQESTVSPLLGEAIVKQGISAGLLGLGLTCLFILIYYRVAGFVAILGLLLNIVMLFGIMAMFGFTFSLPGIAGIVLIIGVAVDANVLINERLREELTAGKSLKNAIEAAYEKAFSAIFDSNITSLITAIILFWLGSSSVKGFAVTLTIGLLCSMFSAILATRVLFRWGIDLKILKNLVFLNLIKAHRFEFLKYRKHCAIGSSALILISVAGFAWKRERSLGIDFTGGTSIQFFLGEQAAIPTAAVEQALADLDLHKTAYTQNQKTITTGNLLSVRCDSRDARLIEDRLREVFPVLAEKTAIQGAAGETTDSLRIQYGTNVSNQFSDIDKALKTLTLTKAVFPEEFTDAKNGNFITVQCDSRDTAAIETKLRETFPKLSAIDVTRGVEAYKIQVSKQVVSGFTGGGFLFNSILAITFGFIGILIYVTVRFEFFYAFGAFIAIIHDCVIAVGMVVLMGNELSLIHVGAVLTIAGYSINDTIIIFDRIRENIRTHTGTLAQQMDIAINATLSRTILTSAVTLICVVAMAVAGGAALRDFSVIILIGIVVGTYSSIFVASPIALWFYQGKPEDTLTDVGTTGMEKEVLALGE
ncbi:MAG: protein translocase subunit SecD [Verrucomicrobia bacterium]|nr:protein translocase subunit SecD [Verrucomicrobiota bacterium]